MTRELTTTDEFQQGVLLTASPHPQYQAESTAHAYYVSDVARITAGMNRIQGFDTIDDVLNADGTYDRTALKELVPASDVVETAEASVLNHVDGDISNQQQSLSQAWSSSGSSSSTEIQIPVGVVKFADQDVTETDRRKPRNRGYYWATVNDRVYDNMSDHPLTYQDDVTDGHPSKARVPLQVVRDGTQSIVAYLAAHNHRTLHIAQAIGRSPDNVQQLLEELQPET